MNAHRLAPLLAAVMVSPLTAQHQNPDGVIPLNTTNQPYVFLVRDPAVHADLALTSDQKQKLTALNDRLDQPLWRMRNKSAQQVASTMQSVNDETRRELATVLTAEQNARIEQIGRWVLGMKALGQPEAVRELGLPADSVSQIREILSSTQRGMNRLRQRLQDGGDAAELNRQYRELQVKQQQDIFALLSDDQKQKWMALLGRRIDTSKLGRIKLKVPDFSNSSGWVNSPPLTLDKLKGKVVALHFYAFA